MQNTKLIKKISTSLVSTGEIIDSLQSNSSTNAPSIRAVNEALSDNFYKILNHAYPIGSIYISINDTNPATLFGGTWERFGKGKTLISVDEDDTDFEEAQKTGGEKEHTLSYAEMPMHNHMAYTASAGAHTHTTTIASGGAHTHTTTIENDGLHSHNFTTDEVEAHTHSVTVNSSGQSNAHNNLQPYITVYMWLRTA